MASFWERTKSNLIALEGAAEIIAGVLLVTNPWAVIIVAGSGCAYLTVKKYLDEPADSKKTFFERLKGAISMAFGTAIGRLTMIGGAVVALVGMKEAWAGNAASFDMVQGSLWGIAASVAVPVVGLVLIGEGSYKAVTGKQCDVISFTYNKVKSGFMAVSNFCGITQNPTKENVKSATIDAAGKAIEGTKEIREAAKIEADKAIAGTKEVLEATKKDLSFFSRISEIFTGPKVNSIEVSSAVTTTLPIATPIKTSPEAVVINVPPLKGVQVTEATDLQKTSNIPKSSTIGAESLRKSK